MTANQPTPVILSDADLLELEIRPYDDVDGRQMARLTTTERDALCATVRALREQLAESDAIIKSYNDAEWKTNTALREQLAARTVDLARESREMQKWNNRANQLAIEGQELRQRLAQVEKEVQEWQSVAEKYQALVARTENDNREQ